MAKKVQGDGDGHGEPGMVTLCVPLPRQVAEDLAALAELYHATREQMVASWTRTRVEELMAGLAADGGA